jgi:hypothetical protein
MSEIHQLFLIAQKLMDFAQPFIDIKSFLTFKRKLTAVKDLAEKQ